MARPLRGCHLYYSASWCVLRCAISREGGLAARSPGGVQVVCLPMYSLFVAIWSVDTVDQRPGCWLLKNFHAKIGGLRLAVEEFSRARYQYNSASFNQPDVSAVFVGPEYLFAGVKNDEYHDRDYASERELKLLKGFVPRPTNTLLVPGSAAYRKRIGPGEGRRTKFIMGLNTLPRHLVEKYKKAIEEKPEFVRNTAYAFLHGQKVMVCHKQSNATDARAETDPEAFVPGFTTNKATFNVPHSGGAQPLTFGIEICADATKEGGSTGYVDRTQPGAVDVKILVSAVLPSGSVYTGNVRKCLIHACSDATHSGVQLIGGGEVNHCGTRRLREGKLDFYNVSLT